MNIKRSLKGSTVCRKAIEAAGLPVDADKFVRNLAKQLRPGDAFVEIRWYCDGFVSNSQARKRRLPPGRRIRVRIEGAGVRVWEDTYGQGRSWGHGHHITAFAGRADQSRGRLLN